MTAEIFNKFLKNRESLIDQYKKGDLSKEEFLEANYICINTLDIKPFKKIDNVKKAVYNYQYYNVLAKYYQKLAHDSSGKRELRGGYLDISDNFYSEKDKATESLLKLLDFKDVEAYFVNVKSPILKKKLFEIVIKDFDTFILHSKNEHILNMLIKENTFSFDERKSLVDGYINQRY